MPKIVLATFLILISKIDYVHVSELHLLYVRVPK